MSLLWMAFKVVQHYISVRKLSDLLLSSLILRFPPMCHLLDDALPSYCKSYLWLDKQITVRFHCGVRLEMQFKDACRQHDPRCASDAAQGHAHSPSDIHSLQTPGPHLLSRFYSSLPFADNLRHAVLWLPLASALCDSCLIGHSPLVAKLPPPASTADEWQRITDEDTMTRSTFPQQGEQREGPDGPGPGPEPQRTSGCPPPSLVRARALKGVNPKERRSERQKEREERGRMLSRCISIQTEPYSLQSKLITTLYLFLVSQLRKKDRHQLTLWTELLDVSSDFTHNLGALKYKSSAMESHKT
ncbi:hypothetical protein QQF64_008753 [Cirrhinus molitorella]|uniref:Uncharacterized protein n=1 Tax=Cirrhinus molitorella TaxID=172907 RepID=A0ABR3M9F0_9TELE